MEEDSRKVDRKLKMAKQNTKQKQPTSRPSMLSKERIVDSDSDSPEELEAQLKHSTSKHPGPIKKPSEKKKASKNGKKHKTSEPGSSTDAESTNNNKDVIEDEASEEDSDNKSDTSSSSGTKRTASPMVTGPQRKKVKPTQPTAIAPKAFKPPNGFEKTSFPTSDYTAGSTEFLTGDLTRKQVWHITAPASVNIKDIKPFNIQDVRSGKPIFSRNGVDYGFLTGSHQTENLLLPNGENMGYTPAMAQISGTYHLREISRSNIKNDADGDKENSGMSFAAMSAVAPRKPREQPVGLRMHYQPYGNFAASKDHAWSTSPPTPRIVPELPGSKLDKSARKKQMKERKASQQAKDSSQEVDAMEVDPTPSSTVNNPDSGKPSESATRMVDKVFEAATETPSKERKRKKKKHRIAEEAEV